MPFGKFKGLAVEDLPSDYLEWLIDTVDLRGRLRDAVCGEANRRTPPALPPPGPPTVTLRIVPDQVSLARDVFDLGHRAAARKLHPDVSGSAGDMKLLNALAESVRSQLAALEVDG